LDNYIAELFPKDEGRLDDKTAKLIAGLVVEGNNRLGKTNFRNKKQEVNLKEIISQQKVNNLRNSFIDKLKRNLTKAEPVDYVGFETEDRSSIWNK
jgi:hypothetical protein